MSHFSIAALFVLRLVLVANIVILGVVGGVCFAYYEPPVRYVFAGLAWVSALVLMYLVPYTDPYRRRVTRSPRRQ